MTGSLQIISKSHFQKPHFSKWQKVQVLLDPIELERLLQDLSPLFILNTSGVVLREKISIEIDEFACLYKKYIAILRGKIPKEKIPLSFALSQRLENFCVVNLSSNKYICRMIQPDVQIQAYSFLLDESGKPLLQVFSEESVPFGLQFSYPAIFQDGATSEVFSTTKNTFSGWKLFSAIRSWIRNHTFPLPIRFQEKNIRLPIRLGRLAAFWITNHINLDRIPLDKEAVVIASQKQTI